MTNLLNKYDVGSYSYNSNISSHKNQKLTVIGVATSYNKECYNWENAIIRNGGIPKLIGVGEKWGGWRWRTQQIVDFLNTRDDNEIFLITDVYDAFLGGNTLEILELFLEYNSGIVVSSERCYSLLGLQKIRPKSFKDYLDLLSNKININQFKHLCLNAGQMIGYCKNLKKLYAETSKFMEEKLNDDQAALWNIYFDWLEGKIKQCPFVVDFKQKIFGSIAKYDDCSGCRYSKNHELQAWKYDGEHNYYYYHNHEYNTPCLHFPGGSVKYYDLFGRKLYNDDFKTVSDTNSSSTISFIIFGLLIIILIILIALYKC